MTCNFLAVYGQFREISRINNLLTKTFIFFTLHAFSLHFQQKFSALLCINLFHLRV